MSMQNVIDSKVVEMSFENQNFESNAKTSLSTIEKLKKALDFKDAANNFDQIDASTKRLNFGALTTGVNSLGDALRSIGQITAFTWIADEALKAKRAVEGFIESVTIKPVSSGWDRYAEKTQAVQTIMAATVKEFEDTEERMGYVNDQLEKLNWFSDETSFNFTDMVSNIGKFTSTGKKLNESVVAMQGISNWAAISGQSTNEASRAMYNLAQALSTGAVKLMDWKSIENANMATAEFKETVLETAVDVGTLTKTTDGFYKTAKGTEVSIQSFNQTLSEGWFSSEVLMDSLEKYGAFATEVSNVMTDIWDNGKSLSTSQFLEYVDAFDEGTLKGDLLSEALEETGLKAKELNSIMEKLTSEEFDLGRRAFKAAQEAKTFGEAIDSVKDAATTGWMNTFELMFGNYLEAKELWTDLANDLYEIFAEGGNKRNELIEEAFSLGDTISEEDWKAFEENGLASPAFKAAIIEAGKAHGTVAKEITADEANFAKLLKEGNIAFSDIEDAWNSIQFGEGAGEQAIGNIEKIREEALNVIRGKYGDDWATREKDMLAAGLDQETINLTHEYVNELSKLTGGVWDNINDDILAQADASEKFAGSIASVTDAQLKELGYTDEEIEAWRKAASEAENLGRVVIKDGKLMWDGPSGKQLWTETLTNSLQILMNIFEQVQEAAGAIFPEVTGSTLYDFIVMLHDGVANVEEFTRNSKEFQTILQGIFAVIDLLIRGGSALINIASGSITGILNGLGINLLELAANIADVVLKVREFIVQNEIFEKISSGVVGAVTAIATKVRSLIDAFLGIPIVQKHIGSFKNAFIQTFKSVGRTATAMQELFANFFEKVSKLGGFKFSNIGKIFGLFKTEILSQLSKLPIFKYIPIAFEGLATDIKVALVNGFKDFLKFLEETAEKLDGTFAGKVLSGILGFIQSISTKLEGLKNTSFDMKKPFEAIKNAAKQLVAIFGKLDLGKVFGITAIGAGGALAGAGIFGIIKIIKSIVDFIKGPGKLVAKFGDILESVSGAINSFSGNLKANKLKTESSAIRNFAIAIALLVGSIAVLTMLDQKRMFVAVGVVAALSLLLVGLAKAMSKIGKAGGVKIKNSIALIAIAASVNILVGALIKLQKVSDENLLRNLMIITGMIVGMTAVMKTLSKLGGGGVSGAAGLLIFAFALDKLVSIFQRIDSMDLRDPMKSILILGALMGGLALVSRIAKKVGVSASVSFLAVAFAINILVGAVEKLSKVEPNGLKRALVAVGVLGACLTAIAFVLGKAKAAVPLRTSVSLLAIAFAIGMLADIAIKLSGIASGNLKDAIKAIYAIGACITAIAFILGKSGAKIGLSTSIGLLAISAAITIIGNTVKSLSEIKPKRLKSAIRALESISLIIGALSVTLGLVGKVAGVGGMVSGTLGILAVAGIITMLAGIIGLVGRDIDENAIKAGRSTLEKGFEFLNFIAEKIGGIIGSFFHGIGAQFFKGDSGTGFAQAIQSISDLFEDISNIDIDSGKIGELAKSLVVVSASGLFSAFADFLTGAMLGDGIGAVDVFKENVSKMAEALNTWNEYDIGSITVPTEGIDSLCSALVTVSTAGLRSAFNDWITEFLTKGEGEEGQGSVDVFKENVSKMAEALNAWNEYNVGAISVPTEGISELTSALTTVSTAGLRSAFNDWITEFLTKGEGEEGQGSVDVFKENVSKMAEAINAWNEYDINTLTVPTEGINELSSALGVVSGAGLHSAINDVITEFLTSDGGDDKLGSVDVFKENVVKMADAITAWNEQHVGEISVPTEGITELKTALEQVSGAGLHTAVNDLITEFLTADGDGNKLDSVDVFRENVVKMADAITAWNDQNVGSLTVPTEGITELKTAVEEVSGAGLRTAVNDLITKFITNEGEGIDNFGSIDVFKENVGKLAEVVEAWNEQNVGGLTVPTEGIAELKTAVTTISTAGLKTAFNDFLTEFLTINLDGEGGQSSIEAFTAHIGDLAEAITTWNEAGITSLVVPEGIAELGTAMTSISTAGLKTGFNDMLTEFVSGDFFTGEGAESSIGTFTNHVGELADAITTWNEAGITNITVPDGLDGLGEAMTSISTAGLKTGLNDMLTEFMGIKDENGDPQSSIENFKTNVGLLADAIIAWNEAGVTDLTVPTGGIDALASAMTTVSGANLLSNFEDMISSFTINGLTGKEGEEQTPMQKFVENVGFLSDALETWNTEVTKLPDVEKLQSAATTVETLSDTLKDIPGDGLASAIANWITGSYDFDKFNENITALGGALTTFDQSIASELDVERLEKLAAAASTLGALAGAVSESAKVSNDWTLMNILSDFGIALVKLGEHLQTLAATDIKLSALTKISKAAARLSDAVLNLAGVDLTSGDINDESKVNDFKTHIESMITAIEKLATMDDSGVEKLKTAAETINGTEINSDTGGNVSDGITDSVDATKNAGKELGGQAGAGVAESTDSMVAGGEALGDALVSTLSGYNDKFLSIGRGFANNIAMGIAGASSNAKSQMESLASIAVSALNSYYEKFKNVGYFVAQGFANGMAEDQSIVRTARKIAEAALQEMRNALQEKSPSKAAYKIGHFVVLGFANAMNDGIKMAGDSAKTFGYAAITGMNQAVRNAKDIVEDTFSGGPTITPVLDLSEIKSGSKAIGDMLRITDPVAVTGTLGAINSYVNARDSKATADDLLSAISELRPATEGPSNTYVVNGVTYDDGSNIKDSVKNLIRYARVERRSN